MLKRTIKDVEFSTEEVGKAFANADDSQQREVLISMANEVDSWARTGASWPLQCRGIVDGTSPGKGLSPNDRIRIASMLGCLIDHLND